MKKQKIGAAFTGLQTRLTGVVLIAILPVFGLVIQSAIQAQRQDLAQARENLQVVARMAALTQERTIEGVRQLLDAAVLSPAAQQVEGAECKAYFRHFQQTHTAYGGLGVVNLKGDITCHSFNEDTVRFAGDRAYFAQALASKSFVVGEFGFGRMSGRESLNFGMPVVGAEGAIKGVAFASLDLQNLAAANPLTVAPGISLTMADRNGTILGTDPAQIGLIGTRTVEMQGYASAKSLPTQAFEALDPSGEERIYAVARVGGDIQSGIVVRASMARDAVVGPVATQLVTQLGLLLAFGALGIGLAWWLGHTTVVVPVRRLVSRVNEVGGLPGSSQFRGRDEVSGLTLAFDAMATALAARARERDSTEAELRISEQRLSTAQRIGKLGNWELDLITQELWWSDQTYEIFGQSKDTFECSVEAFERQVFPDDLHLTEAARADLFSGGSLIDFEHRIVTRDGRVRWVHELGERRLDADGRLVQLAGTVQDISERILSEQLLACEARALRLITSGAPLDRVLLEIVLGLEILFPRSLGSVHLVSPDGLHLLPGAAPHLPTAYTSALVGFAVGPQAGSCGTAVYRREAVWVSDIELDPLWSEHRELARQHGLRACWSLPVMDAQGQVMATFAIYHAHPCAPKEHDRALVASVVHVVGIAIERTRIQGALKASDQRFRSLFLGAATGIAVAAPSGLFLEANTAFCNMVDYSEAELQTMTIESLTYPEDWQRQTKPLSDLLEGRVEGYTFEKRYIAKGGRIVWVRLSTSVLRNPAGEVEGLVCIVEDVTEKTHAAADNLALATQLAHTLESFSDGFFTLDRDWRFTFVNTQAEKLLKRSRSTLLGKILSEVFPVVEGTSFNHHFSQALKERKAVHFEEFYPVLGMALDMSVYPSQEGLAIYFRDVTAQRANKEQLRLLQTAVSRLSDIVLITDADASDDSGPRLVFVNDACERRTGYTRDELLGKSPRIFQGPKTENAELERIRAAMKQWAPVRAELINYTRAGEEFWLELDMAPIADDSGWFTHWVGVGRDITERKQAEQEILKLNADLEDRVERRTEELAAAYKELQTFSYSVSHDLRAPLNTVNGFGQLLLKSNHDNLDDKGKHYLNRIRTGAQQMGELIDGLLSLAQLSRNAIRYDNVNLSDLFLRVEQECRGNENVVDRRVVVSIQPDMMVRADATLLMVVAQNLLGNAWKYTSKQPEAHITVGQHSGDDGEPVYFVRDNGAGFDMEHAQNLFGAFQRLHAASDFSGSGVGLANVKRVVERHGGRVWATAAINEGATFFFTLGSDSPM